MLDIIGDVIVFAYSSFGRISVLYVTVSVSLSFPQEVAVRALRTLVVSLPCSVIFCMCFAYVSFGSSVRPSIFGCFSVGSMVLSSCRCSSLLYSAGSGVKSVVVVLLGLI